MWETNTFMASFHARLNVALRHIWMGPVAAIALEDGIGADQR
jgi:hypothetical protein